MVVVVSVAIVRQMWRLPLRCVRRLRGDCARADAPLPLMMFVIVSLMHVALL